MDLREKYCQYMKRVSLELAIWNGVGVIATILFLIGITFAAMKFKTLTTVESITPIPLETREYIPLVIGLSVVGLFLGFVMTIVNVIIYRSCVQKILPAKFLVYLGIFVHLYSIVSDLIRGYALTGIVQFGSNLILPLSIFALEIVLLVSWQSWKENL